MSADSPRSRAVRAKGSLDALSSSTRKDNWGALRQAVIKRGPAAADVVAQSAERWQLEADLVNGISASRVRPHADSVDGAQRSARRGKERTPSVDLGAPLSALQALRETLGRHRHVRQLVDPALVLSQLLEPFVASRRPDPADCALALDLFVELVDTHPAADADDELARWRWCCTALAQAPALRTRTIRLLLDFFAPATLARSAVRPSSVEALHALLASLVSAVVALDGEADRASRKVLDQLLSTLASGGIIACADPSAAYIEGLVRIVESGPVADRLAVLEHLLPQRWSSSMADDRLFPLLDRLAPAAAALVASTAPTPNLASDPVHIRDPLHDRAVSAVVHFVATHLGVRTLVTLGSERARRAAIEVALAAVIVPDGEPRMVEAVRAHLTNACRSNLGGDVGAAISSAIRRALTSTHAMTCASFALTALEEGAAVKLAAVVMPVLIEVRDIAVGSN